MHDLKLARSARALYLGALLLAAGPASPQSNPQRVDAKMVELTAVAPAGDENFAFSQAEIASLCGDGDGCKLRLALEVEDLGFVWLDIAAGRYLMTSSDGNQWLLEFPGESESRGALSDGMNEIILDQFSSTPEPGSPACRLQEAPALLGGGTVYCLELDPGFLSGGSLRCTLRIDD